MAKRITEHTKLKKGDIVRYPTNEGYFVGIVERNEKFLGHPGFVALQTIPGDELLEELQKMGVDDFTRFHKKDFARMKAEIITSIDLAWMYREARDQIRNFKNSQKNRYDEYDIGN